MALADILVSNGDVAAAKNTLRQTLTTLTMAAENYAKAALSAANAIIGIAEEGGPCAASYTNYAEIGRFSTLVSMTLSNMDDFIELILAAHETGDEYADDAYAEHIYDMARMGEIDAIMEAVQHRLMIINLALPADPVPGARFCMPPTDPVEGAEGDEDQDDH